MALSYCWQWDIAASPGDLWPLISNTDRLNQASGLLPTSFSESPHPEGGSIRHGMFKLYGLTISWLEHPFEWIEGREMCVVRTYETGPLHEIRVRTVLEPQGPGARVTVQIDAEPRNSLAGLIARVEVGLKTRRGFTRVYKQFERFLNRQAAVPFILPVVSLTPIGRSRLELAASKLRAEGFPAGLVDALASLIADSSDSDLDRMRPFSMADRWNADRHQVLRMCLKATRLGLLDLTWDLLCPSCRGATTRAASLTALSHQAHCTSCNVRFDAQFDQSVEVTFRPNEAIRPLSVYRYCVGGPGNTPHIAIQRRLAPGATVDVPGVLTPGEYRIRSPRMKEVGSLTVTSIEPLEAPTLIRFSQQGPKPPILEVGAGAVLRIENATDTDQLLIIERMKWFQDAATASLVTSFQDFRDLFSSEVLKPDERIQVSSLAFLFSDLKSSTSLYEQIGDAPAFALVREHFEVLFASIRNHEGAVVKTIGDAVMAVFSDPVNAVRAAVQVQQHLSASALNPQGIVLKLGVHAGPCLIVNLDNRLDYFGTTVNMAARIQSESVGGDVMMSSRLTQDPGIARYLATVDHHREPLQRELRGLSGVIDLVRIWPEVEETARASRATGTGI